MEYKCAVLCAVLLFASVLADDSNEKESKKDKKLRGKIIGGSAVDITKVPHQVSLTKARTNEHFCGGSIIHSQFILTAAHCVEGMRANTFYARTGSTYSGKGGQATPIAQVIIHPQYNSKTVANDIALLRTTRPMTKGGIIRLGRQAPNAGDYGLATGWGVTNENSNSASHILNYVWLPFIPHDTCRKAYARLNVVTDNMICAGFANGGKDACQGDSGGPLIYNGEQVGIVSWGRGCGRAGSPGVFTLVFNYLRWINAYVPGV